MLKGYPEEIAVSADSKAEYDFLPDATSLVDTLFLADRGYFKLSYLESIDTVGGFYVVRAKTTVNPLVVAAFNRHGKALKRFTQRKQKDVKKHIRRSVIVDMDVEGKTNYRLIASCPPYRPNLNPIERLWKVMNEHVRNNKYFATVKEFRDKIDEFFSQTLPKIGDVLESRINDNFQVLNSAS